MIKFGRASISIKELLENLGEKAVQAARNALIEGAEIVVAEAKERCPVKSGELQKSIHPEPKGKDKIRIIADVQNKKDGYRYGNLIEYSPRGTPFLRPALEAKRDEVHQKIMQAVREEIKK